nr:unnamed protein product [Spirometra erinaceieuropaei]
MDESRKETQALFLAPTRELASQIHQVASALADYLSVKCVLCCGGRSNAGEMGKSVEKGSQIVVGTPGRILEMLRQGYLKLNCLRIFVIDEADEMLNQGLRDQLEQICKRLPTASRSATGDDIFASLEQFQGRKPVQRVVVSATWTSGCREVMQQFLDNPVLILVPRDELTLTSITQSYIDVGGEEWKFEALADIFASICVPQTVVFVNTRRKVEWLAERLTDEGFAICKRLPSASRSATGDDVFASLEHFQGRKPVQRVVVSATWTSGCREVMQQFLDNPVLILVPRDELTLSSITQSYIDVGGEEWKFEALADIFASICVPQTVVFVNTRRKVEWLAERLTDEGFAVSAAHGEMDQTSRDSVMGQFRAGRSRILVTTDVWARGIDVQTVGLVVNYDLPSTAAVYLHRIGRSGRFGRRGIAISLVGGQPTDKAHLATIAKAYGISIEPAPAQLSELTERAVDTEIRPSSAELRPGCKEPSTKTKRMEPMAVSLDPSAKKSKSGTPTNSNPKVHSALPAGKASKKQKLKARRRKNKEKRMKKKKIQNPV